MPSPASCGDHLTWPDDEGDADAWRERWRGAFKLRHREVITTSKQLSKRLAALARAIRDRIRTALAIETESGPLTKLMKAFQTTLVHDLDDAGFADMYAQTIALRPALRPHHRPRAAHGRRPRRPHADKPVSSGADADLPARGRTPRQSRRPGHRLR